MSLLPGLTLVSHVVPVYPGRHVHRKSEPLMTHWPAFRHGFESHGARTRNSILVSEPWMGIHRSSLTRDSYPTRYTDCKLTVI